MRCRSRRAGGADVTREIENLASPATALGLVSLLVFGWAATGMMASLRAGLEVAMRVERGRPGRSRQARRRRSSSSEPRRSSSSSSSSTCAQAVVFELAPAAARPARHRRWPARAGPPQRHPAARDTGGRPAPLPIRARPAAQARRRARRRDRDRRAAAPDLPRLRDDRGARPEPEHQRHLQLAHRRRSSFSTRCISPRRRSCSVRRSRLPGRGPRSARASR